MITQNAQEKSLITIAIIAISIGTIAGLLIGGCDKGQEPSGQKDSPTNLNLSTTPSELNFLIQAPQTSPSPQLVSVLKSGPGAVSWDVDYDSSWLEVTPKSGTDNGTIKVSIKPGSVSGGSRKEVIRLLSDAINTSVTIPVSLTVLPPITPTHIEVNPQSLTFEVTRAQDTGTSKLIAIACSGPETCTWGITYDARWLEVFPSSGVGNATVEVSVSPCLKEGQYSATIAISSNAENALINIPVSLKVKSAGRNVIMGHWPTELDGTPAARKSPISKITHQKPDEHGKDWQWTQVETTGRFHWQHDVKIEDDAMSERIHGNKDNHRIQVGEPAVFETSPGCYRLEFYIKHDRWGDNPILGFKVYIEHGTVVLTNAVEVRKAGNLEEIFADFRESGLLIADRIVEWISGRPIDWHGVFGILPDDWTHQYKGWQLDALYFALQIGDLYARTLPRC